MKNWRNAEIVELNINETAWASFASGGNAGGPEIDVRPIQ